MALDVIRSDPGRGDFRTSLWVFSLWLLWLATASSGWVPPWLDLSMTPVVLVFGALLWNWHTGAWAVLAMAWIYHFFSVFPPGAFWVSGFLVFLLGRLVLTNIAIESRRQAFVAFFVAGVFLMSLQVFVLSRGYSDLGMSFRVVGRILLSSLGQSVVGLIFVAPLLLRSQRS